MAGAVVRSASVEGGLFHCSPGGFGTVIEVSDAGARGRTAGVEMATDGGPAGLPASATSANGLAVRRIR